MNIFWGAKTFFECTTVPWLRSVIVVADGSEVGELHPDADSMTL